MRTIYYTPIGAKYAPRKKKKCPQCSLEVGPRAYKCKDCGHIYNIQKGSSKRAAKKAGTLVKNWRDEVGEGDYIRAVAGTGPYFAAETEEISMGYHGLFKVRSKDKKGILAYPVGKNSESGMCYIYMGPIGESKLGTQLRPHKIRKVDPQFVGLHV